MLDSCLCERLNVGKVEHRQLFFFVNISLNANAGQLLGLDHDCEMSEAAGGKATKFLHHRSKPTCVIEHGDINTVQSLAHGSVLAPLTDCGPSAIKG